MLTPEQCVAAAVATCLAGAAATLPASRSKTVAGWLAFAFTCAGAALIFVAAGQVLLNDPSPSPAALWTMPGTGYVLRIYVDGLAALFLGLVAVIAVPAALYSILYMRHYEDYGVARYYPYFLIFVGAMYGLLACNDMLWFFFLFWQAMTLPGYALIRHEHRKPENVRAANKYLLMMQIACVLIMAGAWMLANRAAGAASRYDFDAVSANLPAMLVLHPVATALAFALFLVGFGIKMGMWPFGQMWLPDAHPAAPSPVSALLSGVMIKTGVYGLLRCFLWLAPASALPQYPLARWGMIVAVLGTITLFTGTMQALKQEQSKRLLAFHSIGQIGYILLGVGTCMALLPHPAAASVAAIALFGALFHVLNHGLFKSLLFFNAGSMLYATGTQDLNKLGGLMKFMPVTAVTALIASFSISGVPLFNGFVSKWTIGVAAIQGSGQARYLALCAVVAILTSALTLASFIKFFGVSFLSRTSALVASKAHAGRLEPGWMMQAPQVVLAFLCVLLGVIPAIAFQTMQRALDASRGGLGLPLANASPVISGPLSGVEPLRSTALFVPLAVLLVLGVMYFLVRGISRLGAAPRRADVPWLCGYAREAESNRYVAHNFYGEIKRYFGWLGGSPRTLR